MVRHNSEVKSAVTVSITLYLQSVIKIMRKIAIWPIFCFVFPFSSLTILRLNEQNLRQAMLSVRNIVKEEREFFKHMFTCIHFTLVHLTRLWATLESPKILSKYWKNWKNIYPNPIFQANTIKVLTIWTSEYQLAQNYSHEANLWYPGEPLNLRNIESPDSMT